jgi:hypothetical protein
MTDTMVAATATARSNSLADLAHRIKVEHTAVADALKDSVRHAIAAGELLVEAKAQVPHGGWMPWLKDNCEISDRTARLYMQVAKNRATVEKQIGNDVADLTLTEAAALIAMSSNIEKLFKFLRDIKHVEDPEQIVQMALSGGVIGVIKDNDYDPFHHVEQDRIIDWHLFALFLVECQNAEVEGAGYHTEYLLQQQFKTPDEWMGDEGDRQRKAWGYQREMSAGMKQQWADFLAEHRGWSIEDIKRRVGEIDISRAAGHRKPRAQPKRRAARGMKLAPIGA